MTDKQTGKQVRTINTLKGIEHSGIKRLNDSIKMSLFILVVLHYN